MIETPVEKPRGRYALHLLWTVPLAVVISWVPLFLASALMCGLFCYSPAYMQYDQTPAVAVLCMVAGVLMFVAVQQVPWTEWARTRLMVSIPAGLLWAGLGFLNVFRVFTYGLWALPG